MVSVWPPRLAGQPLSVHARRSAPLPVARIRTAPRSLRSHCRGPTAEARRSPARKSRGSFGGGPPAGPCRQEAPARAPGKRRRDVQCPDDTQGPEAGALHRCRGTQPGGAGCRAPGVVREGARSTTTSGEIRGGPGGVRRGAGRPHRRGHAIPSGRLVPVGPTTPFSSCVSDCPWRVPERSRAA